MTIEHYRHIFGDKVDILTDTQITEQIACDRQFIQSFMKLVIEYRLTIRSEGAQYGIRDD
ncbi:MAG: hypothetical protein NT149_02240 [Candidatus Gottesmanbacteria bacterium]|nr:hypothetical protein [Candidatus Gottesmanbacteria bacterium]